MDQSNDQLQGWRHTWNSQELIDLWSIDMKSTPGDFAIMATDTSKYKLNRIEHSLVATPYLTIHRFDASSERSRKIRYQAQSPKESLRNLWSFFEWNTMSFWAWSKSKSSLSRKTNSIYTFLPMMDREAHLTEPTGQTGRASLNWHTTTAPKRMIPSKSPMETPIQEKASAMSLSASIISRQRVRGSRMPDIRFTRSSQKGTQEILRLL